MFARNGVTWGEKLLNGVVADHSLRLRRTEQELALSPLFMLPSADFKLVGVLIAFSELRCAPRGTQRKTRGRADRYSFLVKLFHSLLHDGLSRRTVMAIVQQLAGQDGTA
jgi:hypothetical protein